MKINLSGIVDNTLANGKGIRMTIFVQGCKHNCKGCFNKHTHDFNKGLEFDTDVIVHKINEDYITDGVTFSGGDPFEQAKAVYEICCKIYKSKDVWCYTGYTFEQIKNANKEDWNNLLQKIDVLVDGKFEIDLRDPNLKYRGSSNQRIIDVQKSLKENKIILWEEIENDTL